MEHRLSGMTFKVRMGKIFFWRLAGSFHHPDLPIVAAISPACVCVSGLTCCTHRPVMMEVAHKHLHLRLIPSSADECDKV